MAIPEPGRQTLRYAVVLLGGAALVACAGITPRYPSQARGPQTAPPAQGEYKVGKPYQVGGVWYVPPRISSMSPLRAAATLSPLSGVRWSSRCRASATTCRAV